MLSRKIQSSPSYLVVRLHSPGVSISSKMLVALLLMHGITCRCNPIINLVDSETRPA